MFLDYSFMFNRENVKNDDEFSIKKGRIFDKAFILFNDFKFPTPRPSYGNESHTSIHQLDLSNLGCSKNLKQKFVDSLFNYLFLT